MTRREIEEIVLNAATISFDWLDITEEHLSSPWNTLCANDLDLVELFMDLEETLQLETGAPEITKFANLQEVIDYCIDKLTLTDSTPPAVIPLVGDYSMTWINEDEVKITQDHWKWSREVTMCSRDLETILACAFIGAEVKYAHH